MYICSNFRTRIYAVAFVIEWNFAWTLSFNSERFANVSMQRLLSTFKKQVYSTVGQIEIISISVFKNLESKNSCEK